MEAEIASPTNDIQSPTDDKAESCSEDTPSSDDEVEDSNQIQLYTKAEVEDFTGCIPLLLDKCVRSGKIDLRFNDFYDIIDKARGFVQAMRDDREFAWKQYVEHCSSFGT